MKFNISKEWCIEAAKREGDAECGAGAASLPEALAKRCQSADAALASIPNNVYWLLAKGRLRDEEPLYAIQFLRPGTEDVIAEAEGDSIQECVAEANSRLRT